MRKTIVLILFILATIGLLAGCEMGKQPVVNPTPDDPVIETFFYRVSVMGEAKQYEKCELALFEKEEVIANEGNPYDYNYIKIMAQITSPSGETLSIPAFWYQDYAITYYGGSTNPGSINGVASTNPNEFQKNEVVTAVGDPHFRIRFTPLESGEYNVVFHIYKNNLFVSAEHPMKFQVEANAKDYKGVIEVDKTNNATFKYSLTNESYIPVGQNNAWYTSSTRKTVDYDVWFSLMNENNMNQTRIWLAPWGFALHGSSYTDFTDRYAQAARLDKLMEYLETYEVYAMLCLLNHGQFSQTVNPTWDSNPYNVANGGILNRPSEFFTKEEAKAAYKNELMYIIARYSYCPYIMSWELFNEVDWCDGYAVLANWYKTWHSDMAIFIKDNDPYHHMVSTSYKGTDASSSANGLDVIDFVSPHDYSYDNKNFFSSIMDTQNNLMNKYSKPVFFGELGYGGENGYQTYQKDATGICLHQGAWAGMMSGAGGAINWWWDSYVHPYNLYYQFKGAGAFAKLMNITGSFERLQNKAYTSNSNINLMGYLYTDHAYGYLYNKNWTPRNTSILAINNVKVTLPLASGSYSVDLYDANTGEIIATIDATSNGTLSFTVPQIQYDLAFIIHK